ncbi:hypothetical protein BCR34DRAFT_579665 [Clohesyomyces aquaticus]|uniref:NmrA-like domain-containing protein n=1 Tax=Clohesyomyces aquaticus TaxID=1231657 RepID=A0A1Y1YAZ2_9PLEO|nr:hypothetical protein BCR34DRAFT_579665 [Clohesyomyces aquaticus]
MILFDVFRNFITSERSSTSLSFVNHSFLYMPALESISFAAFIVSMFHLPTRRPSPPSTMPIKTALVLRATGVQGTGVTRHLLEAGWKVHGLVAIADDARATKLKALGATLFQGSLADTSVVETAIQGCSALFLNQMPSFTDDSEIGEASSVLAIAKAAGVKHIVHSTQLTLNDPDVAVKFKDSIVAPAILEKGKVEQLVRDSGIPWTIIRPGYFMSNLIAPLVDFMFPELRQGIYRTSMPPGTALPLVDPDDIGAFAVAAFDDPQRFGGKVVSVAGEKLSIENIVAEISRKGRKEVKIAHRTKEEMEKESLNPLVAGQLLSVDLHEWVDLDEVRSWGLPLTPFNEFLDKHKDAIAV